MKPSVLKCNPLPWLKDLGAWTPPTAPAGGSPATPTLWMGSNENPRGPSPTVRQVIVREAATSNRYPDGPATALRHALAEDAGVPPDRIVLGNGSNELLTLVARAYLAPGREAITAAHAFAVYGMATRAQGATLVEVPGPGYGHDPDAIIAACRPSTSVVFIANPNNPTGTWLPPNEIERLLQALPPHVLVVLDEAYLEYVDDCPTQPGADFFDLHPNLVVTRTFSKAWGLAGLRLGYAVAPPHIVSLLHALRDPYNCNTLAQHAALAALNDRAYLEDSVAINRSERSALIDDLRSRGLTPTPSQANFVMCRTTPTCAARHLHAALLERHVVVAHLAPYGLPDHLRITVGTPDENRLFSSRLDAALDALSHG